MTGDSHGTAQRDRRADSNPAPPVPIIKIFVGGVLAVPIALLILKFGPEFLATDGIPNPRDRAEDIARARTVVVAVLAGTLATVGAVLTYYGLKLSREEHEATLALNVRGQITERFTRAVEQLGHASREIRLGGIYALERLAIESPDDQHRPIVEILMAFVRERTGSETPAVPHDRQRAPAVTTTPAEDIQAVLTVLGRRNLAHDPPPPWRTDFRGVHLENADLTGTVLAGADLRGARLDNADLSRMDLRGIDWRGAWLGGAKLVGAHLDGADLAEAHLEGARLGEASLQDADLRGAHLEGADLFFANLTHSSLSDAHLAGARFIGATLKHATFYRATYSPSTEWSDGKPPAKPGFEEVVASIRIPPPADLEARFRDGWEPPPIEDPDALLSLWS